jgi:hypothetical protein
MKSNGLWLSWQQPATVCYSELDEFNPHFQCSLFRRVRNIAKSNYELRYVCPSVCVEQLDSQWKNFHEIVYACISRKSVEKNRVSLKSDENFGHFMKTNMHFWWYVAHSVLLRTRNVSDKRYREHQNIDFMLSFFFFRIVPFMRWRGKISESRASHGWHYGECAFHAGCLRLQTHTRNI